MVDVDLNSVRGFLNSLGALGIVGTVVLGFLAGLVAKVVMPGKDPGGLILTMLIGIGGSWVATYLGHRLHWFRAGGLQGFIAAVVGAFLILFAYRLLRRAVRS
ncbi:MAG: GlsB/YeaQ/YmgE family stress response membrane protein [Elusimicrobia bacterium]|nr:GlsB/YeaQ/YmgE family stress response membrane protein [Elusimicrobiota bacterium]